MLQNYLSIAYRNLKRHKAFSFINIFGLAIGMAACLLILQYVTFQLSFDSFHKHKDRIYRVVLGETVPGRQVTPPALGPALKRQIPEVEQAVRLEEGSGVFSYENNIFAEEDLYFADASFFTIFSYPLLKGNPASALIRPNTVVICQKVAHKYFGDADPLGKVIRMNSSAGTRELLITGILQDIPQYSHLQFDMLISYASLQGDQYNNEWNWRSFYTYILLDPKADPGAVAAKLPASFKNLVGQNKTYDFFWLQPLTDIHVSGVVKEKGSTDTKMIYFLLMLALFILVLAWINYINLSTARAVERAKEVGVRKAVGASRYQLFRQFILESAMLNALGMIIAFTIVQLSLPYFRQLTGLQLSLTLWSNWHFWVALVSLFMIGSFLSGIYPAVILSSFKPIIVLKGKQQATAGGISLRKSLVVLQFAASVALLAGTFTVYYQMQYMRSQDLGMNIEQALVIKGPHVAGDSSSVAKQWNLFKTEIQQMAAVKSMTASDVVPSREYNFYHGNVRMEGMPEKEKEAMSSIFAGVKVDEDFFHTLSIPLAAGRSFSKELATDTQTAILNEEALKTLDIPDPQQAIGKYLYVGGRRYTIIGVVKNYHHYHLKDGYFPTVFQLDPTGASYFTLQINTGNNPATGLKNTIAGIEEVWQRIYPGNPFDYFFLDDSFNQQYEADQKLGSTVALFAFLAILVACLGLFGLASFTTTQRTKEIGIRKVLGASITDIIGLLNKDFIRLVLMANLIAWPLAYWGIRKWLENYEFAIQINLWLFVLPALLVLLIALLTVSVQTLKAARANPVKALKYE